MSGMNLLFVCALFLSLMVMIDGKRAKENSDVEQRDEFTGRMPMHRTDGIFDLIPPSMILKSIGRSFAAPLRGLKFLIQPMFKVAQALTAWAFPNVAQEAKNSASGRSLAHSFFSLTEDAIENFLEEIGL